MKLPVFRDPLSGEPSFTLTVAAITFGVVLVRWCVGGLTILAHHLEPVPDSSITTWLTPTLLAYVARRASDSLEKVGMAKAEAKG